MPNLNNYVIVEIANNSLHLEIAETLEHQIQGLMYRTALADNHGMLFPINPPKQVECWMKNVLISLDILFVNKKQIKAIIENVPPCISEPCPVYRSDVSVDQVIELPSGSVCKMGIKAGDTVSIISCSHKLLF